MIESYREQPVGGGAQRRGGGIRHIGVRRMRFHALRRACPAAAAALLPALLPTALPAQTAGPLKRPAQTRAAQIFIAGEIVSTGTDAVRIRTLGGTLTTLRITGSTEYAPGAENLEPGRYIRVQAVRGPGGPLTALKIWSQDTNPAESERAAPGARGGKRPRPATAGRNEKPAPTADDSGDPGPPILRRRAPGDRSALRRRKPDAAPPPPDFDFTDRAEHYDDPLLARAVAINAQAAKLQVNFICRQATRRFESRDLGRKWKELDLIEAEVLMIRNEGHYQNLRKNGAPTAGTMKDQGGSWSIGEFGATLFNLFVYGHAERGEKARGPDDTIGALYEYRVEQKESDWTLHFANEIYATAYDGRFWIDPHSGRVTRTEMTARGLPADHPLRSAVSTVDYGAVTVDGKEYWLPVSAVVQSCVRHSARCNRNDILFTDYRRFSAESAIFQTESSIEFGEEAAAQSGEDNAPRPKSPGGTSP